MNEEKEVDDASTRSKSSTACVDARRCIVGVRAGAEHTLRRDRQHSASHGRVDHEGVGRAMGCRRRSSRARVRRGMSGGSQPEHLNRLDVAGVDDEDGSTTQGNQRWGHIGNADTGVACHALQDLGDG